MKLMPHFANGPTMMTGCSGVGGNRVLQLKIGYA